MHNDFENFTDAQLRDLRLANKLTGPFDPLEHELPDAPAVSAENAELWAQRSVFIGIQFGATEATPTEGPYLAQIALRYPLANCWNRLPHAPSPEIALSYQRLITAMTSLLAAVDWRTTEAEIADLIERAEAARKQRIEEDELDRWRKPSSCSDRTEQAELPRFSIRSRSDPASSE